MQEVDYFFFLLRNEDNTTRTKVRLLQNDPLRRSELYNVYLGNEINKNAVNPNSVELASKLLHRQLKISWIDKTENKCH